VPAIAVADALRAEGAQVSFLGTRERAEAELVPAAGYEIDFLRVSGLDRRNPVKAARAAIQAVRAVPAARRVLNSRGAEAVLGGGGYVAGPAGLAAVRMGLPLVLTEADSKLGLTNMFLARWAKSICLAFPMGRIEEGRNFVVTGRPIPRAVLEADRGTARARFGLAVNERCLAVVGGSLGARSVNHAAFTALVDGGAQVRVIHVSGRRDFPELERRWRQAGSPAGYTLLDYEPDLGDVLAASDLVLARAGGSVMEIAAAGRPAVLVPYPHATGDHQAANARWMADGGGAVVIPDSKLEPTHLASVVAELLGDRSRLAEMAADSARLARPDAAERIAGEVLDAIPSTEPRAS